MQREDKRTQLWCINQVIHIVKMIWIIQSNSVKTNSTGPRTSVRYNRATVVITVKVYVVKVPFGTRKVELYLLVIA